MRREVGSEKNYLLNCDKEILSVIKKVGRFADNKGIKAYVVGGIVRDLILKRKNLDIDIVVEGDAIDFAREMFKGAKTRITVHEKFKTAVSILPNGLRVDFATARKEKYAKSGALPSVRAGILSDDLLRRDFTINAMAVSINKTSFGELIDEFGGLKDIIKKKIRVLHDKSFIDDPTRILRAVRFEQRFDFRIESKTLLLLKKVLINKKEKNVKLPRYFAEFKKILSESDPLKNLKRLNALGGLAFLSAEAKLNLRLVSRVHSSIAKVKRMAKYSVLVNWWLVYFMALIKDFDDFAFNNVLGMFQFKREEKVSLLYSREIEALLKKLAIKGLMPSQVYKVLKSINHDVILFARVYRHDDLILKRIDRFIHRDSEIKLKINGNDIKAMGIASGKKIGEILQAILFLKIDNETITKNEELKLARQLVSL